MKLSELWLREWVDPQIDTATLCEQLTDAGLEVEGYEPAAGAFTGVVVGEVVKVARHPDAEKLSCCEVSDGANSYQVVCGAPNVRAGMKSPFAKVGAVLPDEFKIKKAKLRGVESYGMLCSAAELGLGDEADGIMDLSAELPVGLDLREALRLDDTCIELDLTPNRGDCLSLRGIAREVGVLNDIAVSYPNCTPVEAVIEDTVDVVTTAPAGCPRYLGRVIRNVDVTQTTPFWMKERLRRCGLRSIDPIVDVTNYVLLELGQPMHAFDMSLLANGIVVRMAEAGEKLTLLDGQQVELDTETLLITDGDGPVAIAGVMGGERSGVRSSAGASGSTDSTRDVFLECAYFAPRAIMGTARRYGLQTDASHRYERGVDYELQAAAVERATALLLDIAGGEPGPVTETVSRADLPDPAKVKLRKSRLDLVVGEAIAEADVDNILERLHLTPVKSVAKGVESGDTVWTVTSPSHRFDIEIEEDLIEEVCRIYGYNRIESHSPVTALVLKSVARNRVAAKSLTDLLVDLGYQEAVTYSFVEPKLQDLLDPAVTPVAVANPMSADQSVMRTNLLPGLLAALKSNVARQQSRVRLFEIGQCFVPTGDLAHSEDSDDSTHLVQETLIAGVSWGSRHPENWTDTDVPVDFFDVKGDVERLLGLGDRPFRFEVADDAVLHPGQRARVLIEDAYAGRLGRLHPEVEHALNVDGPIYLFEFRVEALLGQRQRRHAGVSKFPRVRRDLAVVLAADIAAETVERIVRESLGDILVEFRLFDVYHGKGIDSNEKSLAVGLTLQHPSRTLTDVEVNQYVDDTLASLEREVGAHLR
ncbi:MAG: phenylalanine--tRNA ligase subunit beta [Gammaproteobacteria bacterium]|nr:phenylalanine--tRNA ligase subunit beta [Gammaproteobacteria bacterium]